MIHFRRKKPTPHHFCSPPLLPSHNHTFSMALLQYHAPVDYAAQLDAFKDFLKHFKTLQSTSEAAATEALEDLNIDGNRTSDEYDFMDDMEDEGTTTRGARRRREPKLKYMQILQDIANRDVSHILIELDDLEVVSFSRCFFQGSALGLMSGSNQMKIIVRESSARRPARDEARRVHSKEHQALHRCFVAGRGCCYAQGDQGCYVCPPIRRTRRLFLWLKGIGVANSLQIQG